MSQALRSAHPSEVLPTAAYHHRRSAHVVPDLQHTGGGDPQWSSTLHGTRVRQGEAAWGRSLRGLIVRVG